MVETTSVGKKKPKLSAKARLCLIQTINALPPTQFDELVFALNPPKGVVASNTAPQGQRTKELLDWLEGSTGPGFIAAARLLSWAEETSGYGLAAIEKLLSSPESLSEGFIGPGSAAADDVLQILIPQATGTAPQPVAFAISGKMGDLLPSEIEAIVELLRQKTGDDSISIAFSRAGSIKLILNGSPEGLAKLQAMFKAGELEQLDIPPVKVVAPVNTNTKDARKARLIQALRLRSQSLKRNVRARDIDLAREIIHDIDLARDLARELDRALNSDLSIDITYDIARDLIDALNINITHDIVIGIALNRALTNTLNVTHGLNIALNLSGADLSGANLRAINLRGVDLTGANLTYADVTDTVFGNNPGLTEGDKRNLQSRGAIIQDPPSSDVPTLVRR